MEIGISRIRGNKTGGVQALNTWNTIVLSTGEETISTNNSTTGIQTRCLEIEGSPFDNDEKKASKMYDITSKFHGTAGPEFIKKIIKKYAENDFIDLKKLYDEIMSKVEEKTDSDVLSYISSVSIVTLADILIGKWFFKEEENLSYDMAEFILKNLDSSKDIDVVDKCYEYITSWIVGNHKFFDTYKENKSRYEKTAGKLNRENDLVETDRTKRSFGIYDNDTYFVLIHILEDKLKSSGYSYRKITSEFAKRGYITPKRDDEGNIITTSVLKKYRGKPTRFFAFPIESMEKALSNEEREKLEADFNAQFRGFKDAKAEAKFEKEMSDWLNGNGPFPDGNDKSYDELEKIINELPDIDSNIKSEKLELLKIIS